MVGGVPKRGLASGKAPLLQEKMDWVLADCGVVGDPISAAAREVISPAAKIAVNWARNECEDALP